MQGQPRKPEKRKAARRLRREGYPLKRIAKTIGSSLSSVSLWTRDIQLSDEQRARKRRVAQVAVRRRAASWSESCRYKRTRFQAEGRARARQSDPLHLAGCMLYWAEGTKGRNAVDFANSDPRMVALFCRFLVSSLGVERTAIRLSLNVYTGNGLSIAEIEEHWLTLLGLTNACVRKHTLNHTPTSSSGRKRNRLPYGVCAVRVYSTRVVQHIYGAIQEYAGFEEPAWLD